jgi:hypothetical protein
MLEGCERWKDEKPSECNGMDTCYSSARNMDDTRNPFLYYSAINLNISIASYKD